MLYDDSQKLERFEKIIGTLERYKIEGYGKFHAYALLKIIKAKIKIKN
jgi:hypothetical protein